MKGSEPASFWLNHELNLCTLQTSNHVQGTLKIGSLHNWMFKVYMDSRHFSVTSDRGSLHNLISHFSKSGSLFTMLYETSSHGNIE